MATIAASAATPRRPSSSRTADPVATSTVSPTPAPTVSTATNSGPSPAAGVTFRSLKSASPGAFTVETVLPTTRQSCMASFLSGGIFRRGVVDRADVGAGVRTRRIGREVVDEARLCLDTGQPRLNGREGRQIEPGLGRQMGVGVDGDVGDRVAVGEELA